MRYQVIIPTYIVIPDPNMHVRVRQTTEAPSRVVVDIVVIVIVSPAVVGVSGVVVPSPISGFILAAIVQTISAGVAAAFRAVFYALATQGQQFTTHVTKAGPIPCADAAVVLPGFAQ